MVSKISIDTALSPCCSVVTYHVVGHSTWFSGIECHGCTHDVQLCSPELHMVKICDYEPRICRFIYM